MKVQKMILIEQEDWAHIKRKYRNFSGWIQGQAKDDREADVLEEAKEESEFEVAKRQSQQAYDAWYAREYKAKQEAEAEAIRVKYTAYYNKYLDEGMSREEARARADKEMLGNA